MFSMSVVGALSVVNTCVAFSLWYSAWINPCLDNDPDMATEHHSFSCFPCSTKHADSIDLELEVDPLNVDHFSCTPLVRAGSETSESLRALWGVISDVSFS